MLVYLALSQNDYWRVLLLTDAVYFADDTVCLLSLHMHNYS